MARLLRDATALILLSLAPAITRASKAGALRARGPTLADCLANNSIPIRAIAAPVELYNLR